MAVDLEQALLEGGTRFVNFFEGRILTGRDLRDEQAAARTGRRALGRALGAGVVHGLEVTDASPAAGTPELSVTAGLGVNREGQTLHLPAERRLRLAELAEDDARRSTDLFGPCGAQPAGSDAPTAEGFHLLTLAPATGYEGEAPKSGLGEAGTAGSCGRRYVTLGLQFRLLPFDPAVLSTVRGAEIGQLATSAGAAEAARLQNLVAQLGFGETAREAFAGDPFAAPGSSGLEALLRAGAAPQLTACELPLAVLRLSAGRVTLVDMWTVRRRPRPLPAAARWPLLGDMGRPGIDEAVLFQFQAQLAALRGTAAFAEAPAASRWFRFLPPVGFLPTADPAAFFGDETPPLALAPARLIPVIAEALAYPPVDLAGEPGFVTYHVGEAPGWTLFVHDAVPSAERQAARCAALAGRVDQLETALAALAEKLKAREEAEGSPGHITGKVVFRIDFGFQQIENPVGGMTLRASDAEGVRGEAVTNAQGVYDLALPAGTYALALIFQGKELTGRGITGIALAGGQTVTRNITLALSDLLQAGAL